jgi:long-chain fatty acid transport protein
MNRFRSSQWDHRGKGSEIMKSKSSNRRTQIGALIIVIWLVLLLPSVVHANGFRVLPQSASAAGQGNAFTAQSDDPSALFYNPSGITQLNGIQLTGGGLIIGGTTHFTNSATGARSEGGLAGTVATPLPLHFYLTANLKPIANALDMNVLERLTVGLSVFSPFGLNGSWPKNGPLNTSLTDVDLPLIEIRPVLAVKLTESFSLAVGADVYTFQDLLGEGKAVTQFRSSGAPGLPPAGTPLEVNGKDTAVGFNLSLHYTPCLVSEGRPHCSLGLQYRSRAHLRLDGKFIAGGTPIAKARTNLVLPQSLTVGAAIWPIRDAQAEWKIEFDADWTDWSQFKNTDVQLSNGSVIRVPRNWRDSFTPMLGTEYKWIDPAILPNWDLTVRAGYLYSTNVVPHETFDPALPDNDNHTVTVGLGFLCRAGGKFAGVLPCGGEGSWYRPSAIGFDLAYQAAIFETRHISGNRPPLTSPAVVNGTYKTVQHLGLISLRVNF